jgi:hypothetical protein
MEKLDKIHFPGCWPQGDVADFGPNWRFVGSTHVIPRQHLAGVDFAYKAELADWVRFKGTVPLDLMIWANTEKNWTPMLPFEQYVANHDATQLSAFPFGE